MLTTPQHDRRGFTSVQAVMGYVSACALLLLVGTFNTRAPQAVVLGAGSEAGFEKVGDAVAAGEGFGKDGAAGDAGFDKDGDGDADGRVELTLEWSDCSEDDGDDPPGEYHAKVVGLDVYYTSTGAPTPRFKGKQTLPLGRNLTIVFATLNRIPTPPGTSFAAAASGFPFSMSGSTCDAQAIAIPLGLGGVHFSGRSCPLPPGLQKTNVTVLLPEVLPLGQLSFLNMQSLSLDVKQVLPSVDGAPEVKLCCSRVHSEIFSPGGRPTFGFGFNPFG
mmetsp:Transcript_23510/g.76586  ORF Transcript_23510/g.76586 Transcript_23510/m.76586 type:complete len:275 (+) Transcript_23510:117-941(+)